MVTKFKYYEGFMSKLSQSQCWRSTILPLDSSIQKAIHSLESSSLQIVLAVSEDGKFIGTLTDGDIRRAFLKGYKLESSIVDIIHRDSLTVTSDINREQVLQLMKVNRILQLPILDSKSMVVGLHVWDSINSSNTLENMMVIMAGGKGTRLRPYTENCPKPMLQVGEKPILEHIIKRANEDGFKNFLISLNYLGEMIEDYFGDGSKFNVNINYLKEDKPLGTAGCLSLIKTIPDKPFVVTNGDVLTQIHYDQILNFHLRQKAQATMAVRQHETQVQYGVVMTEGVELIGFKEKPIYLNHVNAGVYVLNPEALKYLDYEMHCDMPELFESIKLNAGSTIVYPMHESWLDIGRPDDLALANKR